MGRFKLTGNLRPYPDPVHQMAPSLLWRSSGNQTGVEAELPLMHLEQDGEWIVKTVARSGAVKKMR